MLIIQMIKGCKEKFFINQIFDENIRRLHQGKKFFGKKAISIYVISYYEIKIYYYYYYCTHFGSAFLCRCSFRYQSSLLFLGTNSDTARARNCHPCKKVKLGGLILGSAGICWALPSVGEAFWAPEESQRNKLWVAHRRRFCRRGYYGMRGYYRMRRGYYGTLYALTGQIRPVLPKF